MDWIVLLSIQNTGHWCQQLPLWRWSTAQYSWNRSKGKYYLWRCPNNYKKSFWLRKKSPPDGFQGCWLKIKIISDCKSVRHIWIDFDGKRNVFEACHDVWMDHYTPESKIVRKEFQTKDEILSVNSKTRSCGRFSSWMIDFLHDRPTINDAHKGQLLEKTKAAQDYTTRCSHHRFPLSPWQREATHSGFVEGTETGNIHLETIEPPYSPDLPLYGYLLFAPSMGKDLTSFRTLEKSVWNVMEAMSKYDQ